MSQRTLLKNMSWLTLVSGIERVAAVLQTVLIARALGITDYGVYGLIFGTIGMTASVAGLQMGLTATVFLARYRDTAKAKAAFVISFVNRFGLAVAVIFLLCTIPFADTIARWLILPLGSTLAVKVGCLLVAFSILSGVQDGVIQGFEDFRSVAATRMATTILTLICIYPASVKYGLLGTLCTALIGVIFKILLLVRKLESHIKSHNLPIKGEGLLGRDIFLGFSFPSLVVSLLVGVTGWIGTVVLSRQVNGFEALALVNTGLQWRGPIFLLTSAVASVVIPAMSRYYQAENHSAILALQRQVLLFSGGFALFAAVILSAFSGLILRLYGPDFTDGNFVFSIMLVSAVPQVVAGAFLQNMVAKGLMWRQLVLHLWLVVPLGIGFAVLVPMYESNGFAIANLLAWCIFSIALSLNGNEIKRSTINS